MRTSSQLLRQYTCEKNNGADISIRQDYLVKAQAQKQVLKDMLLIYGNQNERPSLEEIKSELLSRLSEHEISFENRYQENETIDLYAYRILRYLNYEQREIIMPEVADMTAEDSDLLLPDMNGQMQNTVIDYYGEPVKVLPDYITRNGHTVHIVKIHTGRTPKKAHDAIETNEVEALAKLGEKLYPGEHIYVEINYLADVERATEKKLQQFNAPFNPTKEQLSAAGLRASGYAEKSRVMPYSQDEKNFFAAKHEQDEAMGHEPDMEHDCASCPRVNVCNYTEPPIAHEAVESVRPITDIHLTHSQRAIIDYRHGTARVNAGAGAGKTLTVAWRMKELLKEGIPPERLCLITFTNAGAEEMTARVKTYSAFDGVDVDWDKFTSTTFNAFCQSIIDEHYEELGFSRPPKVIPEEVRADRINTILGRYPKVSRWSYDTVSTNGQQFFSKAKTQNSLQAAKQIFATIKREGYTRTNNPWTEEHHSEAFTQQDLDNIFQMYSEYDRTIKAENRIEFDDQIQLVFKLLETRPRLFDEIGFQHIIVDEFQDTDLPQIKLLQKMKDNEHFESLMCVGDDSQSIFGFRHTSPEYMINFGQYLGDGNDATGYRFDDFMLMENHRSTSNIIEFANKINEKIESRVVKDLIPVKEAGSKVFVDGYDTPTQEYRETAKKIKAEIDAGKAPCDIAFLANDKYQLQKMADALTNIGIPSVMMNPIPYLQNSRCAAIATFFDSFLYKTTQGCLDYLNALEHGDLATASAEMTNQRVKEFAEALNGQEITYDKFMEYVKALDADEKDECFQDFISSRLDTCQSMDELKDLFHALKLYGQTASFKREGKYDGVCLTTIHSAKGLEWDSVYYTVDKLDQLRFHSSYRSPARQLQEDEYNRLWFVAATRARTHCECVGQYLIKDTREDVVLNNKLKDAYQMVDKPYGYNYNQHLQAKALEKQEMQEQAKTYEVKHMYDPGLYSRQEKQQAPKAPKTKSKAPKAPGVRHREMTPEQRAEYDALTENATQMTIADYLDQSMEEQQIR